MKLTILGKHGPFPKAGGACSGYLIEDGKTKVLIECGSGVLGKLQEVYSISSLDAVILSHLHSDHTSDMMVLRYALDVLKNKKLFDRDALNLYLPGNPIEEYNRLASQEAFKASVLTEGASFSIGDLSFSFKKMTHPYESYGICISNGDKKFVYTGDTNYNPYIADFAQDADLFLADTVFLDKDLVAGKSPHLSAAEVGKIATQARVKKLILTHINPTYDENELLEEASLYYGNPILAQEMQVYEI